ncbi:Asp23/Gls24 family envelope stress response protein [Catellatospora bangladeshensis]|uniref:Stress protein n=1 Tax=Catellatospora bangladeshensis TaxID=310355 RepID=A0A8J3JVV8_9ACTN|nr:Asp23/Gls24 family envelope stress response protein [Catellatospora bangladeshensis]GIF84664.1 stress protein [Catellatospora bangladeshensis]
MTQTTVERSPVPTTGQEKSPKPHNDRLTTDTGKISVAQGVVQKIAGIACREVAGVYSMGTGTARAFGAIRERIPGSAGPNVAQGVGVEVGETQAAVDLDIVVDYGASIAELGRSVQRNVKQSIERMTGLEVVEVNVNVDDVHLPDSGEDRGPARVE